MALSLIASFMAKTMAIKYSIRKIHESEFAVFGKMTSRIYQSLPGMPSFDEQPDYYSMIEDVRSRTTKKSARVYIAVTPDERILGGLSFIGDAADYDSGGSAPSLKESAGVRLLAVDPDTRGLGVGTALMHFCIEKARLLGAAQMILHTTDNMQDARRLYQGMGFSRFPEIDFQQGDLEVYGYRLPLHKANSSTIR